MLFIFTCNTAIRSSCFFTAVLWAYCAICSSALVTPTSPCHIPCASVYRISLEVEVWGHGVIGLSDGIKYYQILLLQRGCVNVSSLQQDLEVAILLTPTQTPGKNRKMDNSSRVGGSRYL